MNYYLMTDKTDFQSAILFLLAVLPKGAVTFPSTLLALVHLLQIHHFSRRHFIGFFGTKSLLTRDHRSALEFESMQVVESLASPTRFEPVFTP